MTLPQAILILGPTGSGKTPLGEALEANGIQNRNCRHFDFGNRLRQYAAAPSGILSEAETAVVRTSLATGALLEDQHFGIAEKLLREFIAARVNPATDLIIMNGLPRHTGQAAALKDLILMRAVVVLDCSPEVIFERINRDTGGDRRGRTDDEITQIRQRLQIFNERTLPLLDHYRNNGQTRLIRLPVGVETSAEDALSALTKKLAEI